MESRDFYMLVQFFKTLADENRLKMIGLMSDAEYRVSDLADILSLTEPTVSHHLKKLRETGLVNLRIDGNSHYYRLNTDKLNMMQQRLDDLQNMDKSVLTDDEDQWLETLDALDMDQADIDVIKTYTRGGHLVQIPTKQKKLLVILRWISTYFERDKEYSEKEVNKIIGGLNADISGLRRDLVDFGFLRRAKDGSRYWVP